MNGATSGEEREVAFMVGSGVEVGGKARTVFAARVAGVDGVRSTRAARVLPETAALIPMKTQTPKRVRRRAVTGLRKIKPDPFPDNLGQFVLLWQLRPQKGQDFLRGKLPVRVVFGGAG